MSCILYLSYILMAVRTYNYFFVTKHGENGYNTNLDPIINSHVFVPGP